MRVKRAVLLNTTVIPGTGTFRIDEVTVDQQQEIYDSAEKVESFVGHSATAEAFSTILDRPVEARREPWVPDPSDIALVFQLNKRLPEGVVITDPDELMEVGVTLKIIYQVEGVIPKKGQTSF